MIKVKISEVSNPNGVNFNFFLVWAISCFKRISNSNGVNFNGLIRANLFVIFRNFKLQRSKF